MNIIVDGQNAEIVFPVLKKRGQVCMSTYYFE